MKFYLLIASIALVTLIVVGMLLQSPRITIVPLTADSPYDRFTVGSAFGLNGKAYIIDQKIDHKIVVKHWQDGSIQHFIIDLDKESLETLKGLKLYNDISYSDLEELICSPPMTLDGTISKNLQVGDSVKIRTSDHNGVSGTIVSISNDVYVVQINSSNFDLRLLFTENELEKVNNQKPVAERPANKYEPGDKVRTIFTTTIDTITMRQFKNNRWLYDVTTPFGLILYEVNETDIAPLQVEITPKFKIGDRVNRVNNYLEAKITKRAIGHNDVTYDIEYVGGASAWNVPESELELIK
jgi:hypothetical protein